MDAVRFHIGSNGAEVMHYGKWFPATVDTFNSVIDGLKKGVLDIPSKAMPKKFKPYQGKNKPQNGRKLAQVLS